MPDDQNQNDQPNHENEETPTEPPKADTQDVGSLPEWAQKQLRDARSDAGKARIGAKQQAAQEARSQLAQEIGKALGLVKGDEQTDPAKLADQLTEREQQLTQHRIELAAYRAAGKHGADPDALLDSRGVVTALSNLDPSADDFASQVDAAIKAAVESNPKLKASQAPGPSSTELPGGSGESTKPRAANLTDAVANYYRT